MFLWFRTKISRLPIDSLGACLLRRHFLSFLFFFFFFFFPTTGVCVCVCGVCGKNQKALLFLVLPHPPAFNRRVFSSVAYSASGESAVKSMKKKVDTRMSVCLSLFSLSLACLCSLLSLYCIIYTAGPSPLPLSAHKTHTQTHNKNVTIAIQHTPNLICLFFVYLCCCLVFRAQNSRWKWCQIGTVYVICVCVR